LTAFLTCSTACTRVALSAWLIASAIRAFASSVTRAVTASAISGLVHAIFSVRPAASISSFCIAISSRMPVWLTVSDCTTSSSLTSRAPPSTITIESCEPATTKSRSEYSSCWNVGLRIQLPCTRPTRTPAIGPAKGTRLTESA
jgi:hypothetical protein